jgi:hypothetical protein
MKPTKAELRVQNDALESRATLFMLALNDSLNGLVTWQKKGRYSVGTCREKGAAGGIVLIRSYLNALPFTDVQYFEDAIRPFRGVIPSEDKDSNNLRELLFAAETRIQRVQNGGAI